jgi:FtsP/CotA-like multicopper oxidase with cupredoxin domain
MGTDKPPASRSPLRGWIALGAVVLVAAAATVVFATRQGQPSAIRSAAELVAPSGQAQQPGPGGSVRDLTLTAAPATLELRPGLTTPVWAYDGTVPGPELRVQTGDLVRVRLDNRLPVRTTIHWHGVPVPNGEDGVAGLTQDAVPPGGSATYAFVAPQPGTFWYHSHQDSANQVGRGLYGALVVEPRAVPAGVLDRTLIYGEWPLGQPQPTAPPGDGADMERYGVYSVDGRTGPAIQPVRFQPGQTVRLRLVNAGNLTHYVHPHVAYRIVGIDGSELTGGPMTDHAIPLGAGERVEIEFRAPDAPVWITAHDPSPPASEIGVVALPEGMAVPSQAPEEPISGQVLDLDAYPARATADPWPDGTSPTRSFTLRLGEATTMPSSHDVVPGMPGMPGMNTTYTINGAVFPKTGVLTVQRGDRVELTFVNSGRLEHAMHLHGHAFRLLARDGKPLPGALVMDTVLVEPGSSYTVGFTTDNPGWWAIHCHELHHAAGGMMALLRYDGSQRLAQAGGAAGNDPE